MSQKSGKDRKNGRILQSGKAGLSTDIRVCQAECGSKLHTSKKCIKMMRAMQDVVPCIKFCILF